MNTTAHNRTALLMGLMILAGFLACVLNDTKDLIAVIAAVAVPVTNYISIKGKGSNDS